MSNYTDGEISTICYDVYRGSKPCGLVAVQKRYTEDTIKICKHEKCLYKIEGLDECWDSIWIYKCKELLDIINLLPKYPETKADHYLLGALFGYSNESICEFIGGLDE